MTVIFREYLLWRDQPSRCNFCSQRLSSDVTRFLYSFQYFPSLSFIQTFHTPRALIEAQMFTSYSTTSASMRRSSCVDDEDLSLGRKNIYSSNKFLICSFCYSNRSFCGFADVWWQFLQLSVAKQIYLGSRENKGAHFCWVQ